MVKTPFFISPAYWLPKMTIFLCWKLRATQVSLSTSGMCLLAWNYPWNRKKRTCIENVVIGSISKIFLKLLFSWFNQHIGHEKGVVRSGTNNSDSNSLGEVVSCVSIDDVESLSSVEIVSGQVFQNCEGTGSHGDIDFSPTDLLFTNWVSNDSFGRGGTAKVK